MKLPSRIIKGLINQSGTDAPTIEYLQNDFNTSFTCTRIAEGIYDIVLDPIFHVNRTWLYIGGQKAYPGESTIYIERRSGDDTLRINTYNSLGPADGILNETSFLFECFCDGDCFDEPVE
jgi:hypothetical protein